MPLHIADIETFVFRCPLETPVQTSFGVMHDRPMVLVRIRDRDGVFGWGEAWCNFPAVGAEHRARLIDSVVGPLIARRTFETAEAATAHMTAATEILAIQCGELGPIAQAIAAVDTALHDLEARRRGLPLWRHLGGAGGDIAVYASGINPTSAGKLAEAMQAAGHRAFKLKVGFGRERDLANLAEVRAVIGPQATLMVDANQGWSLDTALAMAPAIEPFGLSWLEEPLRADRPWREWQALAAATTIPLAGGENIAGDDGFNAALAADVFAVVQPDAAKWGGISGCLRIAKRVHARGRRFCPHYLGGGVGLLASAHLLAAAGGDGLLEIDANPNPLRSRLASITETLRDGRLTLSDAPGLGIDDPVALVAEFRVGHSS